MSIHSEDHAPNKQPEKWGEGEILRDSIAYQQGFSFMWFLWWAALRVNNKLCWWKQKINKSLTLKTYPFASGWYVMVREVFTELLYVVLSQLSKMHFRTDSHQNLLMNQTSEFANVTVANICTKQLQTHMSDSTCRYVTYRL